jgi:hypothetical protein
MVAASPTTNIPRESATFKNGPTHARPARSVATPSILTIGDGETPAVHNTVQLSILFPPTVTALIIDVFDHRAGDHFRTELGKALGRLYR